MKKLSKSTITALSFSLARVIWYFFGGVIAAQGWITDGLKSEMGIAALLAVMIVWGEKRFRRGVQAKVRAVTPMMHLCAAMRADGRWLSRDGWGQRENDPPFKRHWLLRWVKIKLYTIAFEGNNPLTFERRNGDQVRTGKLLRNCDLGSVPLFAQYFGICKDTFLRTFFFHDWGCEYHGFWILKNGETEWKWTPFTRKEVNDLLRECIPAEGGTALETKVIYNAVEVGLYFIWRKAKELDQEMAGKQDAT
jgi:hypothetical protein